MPRSGDGTYLGIYELKGDISCVDVEHTCVGPGTTSGTGTCVCSTFGSTYWEMGGVGQISYWNNTCSSTGIRIPAQFQFTKVRGGCEGVRA